MGSNSLKLLSVLIPARNEQECVAGTVQHLHAELAQHQIPHEIIVIDDGSSDGTWGVLQELSRTTTAVRPIRNDGPNGFGRAVTLGIDAARGDGVVVMMADESDDCRDVVKYWALLNDGWDCVLGSRFMKGAEVVDYPWLKLRLNRLANLFIRVLFKIPHNDITNAFKAYRRSTLEGCRPFLSPHFNLTVELPLKAIVRGYTWTAMPVTWRNRRTGISKLKLREMGSRYFFIVAYVWLEKYFSRGDYRKSADGATPGIVPMAFSNSGGSGETDSASSR
jgi:dolichol-phosphate mannosyltransferase